MSLAKYTKSLGELSRAFHRTPFGEIDKKSTRTQEHNNQNPRDELLQRVFVYFSIDSKIKDPLLWCRSGKSLQGRFLVSPGERSRATLVCRSGSGATLVGRSERSLQGHLRLFGVMRTRATSWRRFRKVALRSGTQRLRDVAPGGRSHARSLRNRDFLQQNNAERLAGVAPGSRSRADFWCLRARGRERLWCVAPTGRSGSGATLVGRSERSLQGHLRLFGVMRTRATSWRRFRKVALRSGTQRLRDVAPGGRSHARFVQWSPFHLF
ncbi:hypothetical protein IGI04_008722 [Brassica rapa subsp. trilocularis]|uniref:Uncharacterized protein n=1 Tax=Brassica rapa subsp. trilocularis TaxID=1813537 RepID=A0ABQ7NNE9_BRACM|nr:hypothetical protein IGI04_008722 [Brassica rapa subsp. trilocularis]